jgi:cobalt-zinc-cadmium efflux system protein
MENRPGSNRRLFWTIVLNAGISAVEVAGGLMANSLALLSDALHNLSDVLTSIIAWSANRIGGRKSNLNRTFGYKRIEILAASLNSIILIVISVYLIFEAISRFGSHSEISGKIMFVVASFGFTANFIGMILLRRDAAGSLNIKAAYLHFLGDALASLAVIVGGLLIWLFGIYWIDPVVTILIGLFILYEGFKILKQTNAILMQGTPSGIDLIIIKSDLEAIEEIANIHHVHAWNMNENEVQFECHVDLKNNLSVSETEPVSRKIREILIKKHNIRHTTIQYEYDSCHDKSVISH